tara:strand:+ start:357 stop:2714 length:2358 start_codon:yes stop_codon:yes gene_type:complete
MATFEAQVEGLTSLSIDGSSAPTQTELTQFLTDGAKEILNVLPSAKKALYTTATSLNSSSANLTIGGSEIFSVTRDDGTINQPCRLIPANMSGRASDSDDMNAASATDPVYYITNNILSVIPEPTNSNNAQIQTLAYPSVAYGDSSITRFPDEAEYLVPLYASVKALQNVLGSKTASSTITTALTATNDNIDASLSEIALAKIEAAEIASQTDNSGEFETACDAMKAELDKVDEIILLAHEEFDEVAAEVSSTATSPITQARSAVPSAISINDLNITSPAPQAPSLATVSYSDASNADASTSAVGAITVASVSTADMSGNVPAYTKPGHPTQVSFEDFFNLSEDGNPFGDNDPLEFSTVAPPVPPPIFSNPEVSPITIGSFGTAPAYTAPTVGGATEELTASLTALTSNEPGTDADFLDFSKWFTVVGEYIEDSEDIELANVQLQKISAYISAYQAALQNQLNVFNDANVEYQATIQKQIEQSRLDSQDAQQEASLKLQKETQEYQAKISQYQAQVNSDVQSYSQKIDRYKTEINLAFQAWSKTESDNLQVFQLDIQNELNEFNKENVRYQANVQAELAKHNSDLQKALTQARIDAEDAQQEAAQTVDIDKFNKAQDQALDLANKAKALEASISNNDDLIAKFSAELNKYSAQVNKEVQEYQANIQQKIQEVESSIKIQSSYYQEAQARVNAGSAFLQQAQSTIAQANGYAQEVSARSNFTSAKVQAVQSYISTANSYVQSAQAYANEVQARLTVDSAYYSWYEKQQAKLQADYDKGLQLLLGGN